MDRLSRIPATPLAQRATDLTQVVNAIQDDAQSALNLWHAGADEDVGALIKSILRLAANATGRPYALSGPDG